MLAALAGGEPMTAGQVAEKAGLTRSTVSTTLSKLAKSGELEKAERGYRLAAASASTNQRPGTSSEAPAKAAGQATEPTAGESNQGDSPPPAGGTE